MPYPTIETTLLRGRVKLVQPEKGFHASLDSVFLSAAYQIKNNASVLDIGCGVGSVGLCVISRNKNISLYGLDIQPEIIDLAKNNARLNGVDQASHFVCGNLLSEEIIPSHAFDYVFMNPPYQKEGTFSDNKIKSISHHEGSSGASLEDWCRYAHKKLKNGAYLAMVHRADRLDDMIRALTSKRWFGSLVITPLWPGQGKAAKRVIICARKERYVPLKLTAGIVLHQPDGCYTPAAEAILSDGKLLEEVGGTE